MSAKNSPIQKRLALMFRSIMAGASVYGATKHFWGGMSDGLRKELVGTGVKVTNILPGLCNTPLIRKSGVGEEVRSRMIQPEDVGLMVWEAVNKPERCYVKDICMLDIGHPQTGSMVFEA